MLVRYCFLMALAFFLLLLGAVVYSQAGNTLIAYSWLPPQLAFTHQFISALSAQLPTMVVAAWVPIYIPDICWAAAIAIIMVSIWAQALPAYGCLILGSTFAISYECLQGLGYATGSFDINDLLFSFFIGLFASWLTIKMIKT